jgi:hypothetical protein
LSVSILGGHLDGVCTSNEASILCFVPWEIFPIFIAVHLPSKVFISVLGDGIKESSSQHIFQIHEHTCERERLYPAHTINPAHTL